MQVAGSLTKQVREGVFVEQLEHDPAKHLPSGDPANGSDEVVKISLDRP